MRLLYVKSQPDSFSLDPGQTHSFYSRAAVDFPCLRRWRESIVTEIVDKVTILPLLDLPSSWHTDPPGRLSMAEFRNPNTRSRVAIPAEECLRSKLLDQFVGGERVYSQRYSDAERMTF